MNFKKYVILLVLIFGFAYPQSAFAGFGVEKLTLQSERFDGKSLVYEYIDETGAEHDVYFRIPDSVLDEVLNSGDPVTEAKTQLFAVYTLFELKDRISQLKSEFIYDFDVEPKIDPNFKVRFQNENTRASENADQLVLSLSKDSYNTIQDKLTPILTKDNMPAGEPDNTDNELPGDIEQTQQGKEYTWVWTLGIILGIIGISVAVFRKRGVR